MPRLNPLARFICGFTVFFALLAAPWPGWNEAGSTGLRALVTAVFAGGSGPREVVFEPHLHGSDGVGDTRAVIVNRDLMARDGSGPVRNLDMDLGRLGLRSAALLLALIFATPIPWKRRACATLAGLVGLFGLLLAVLAFSLWVESAEVRLVQFSPTMKPLVCGLKTALLAQFGLATPVLIWIVVTLRREDALRMPRCPAPIPQSSERDEVLGVEA